jgi:hypothetical protein
MARAKMSRESERLREIVEALDGSTSLQVGAAMPLFNRSNVEELLLAMPIGFRADFLGWCLRMLEGGAPLREWAPEFAQGFDAVCTWMAATARETAEDVRTTEKAEPQLDDGVPFQDNEVPERSHELPRKAA